MKIILNIYLYVEVIKLFLVIYIYIIIYKICIKIKGWKYFIL
jgi:hypothetical protein